MPFDMLRILFITLAFAVFAPVVFSQKTRSSAHENLEPADSLTTENVVERLAAFPPYEQVLAQLFASLPDEQLPLPEAWSLDRHPDGWLLRDRADGQVQHWIWRAQTRALVETLTLPAQHPIVDAEFRRLAYAAWTEAARAQPYTLRVFVGYPAANRHTIHLMQTPGEWPPHLLQALGLANLEEARRVLEVPPLPPDSVDLAEAHLRKAVDAYRRLNASAPDYSAVEGRPVLALDLALAEGWSLMERSGHAARGKVFLDQVQFSPFYTAYGRNLLQGLPDSAVLFCPNRLEELLVRVIQFREKLRRDVRVVGGSLAEAEKLELGDSPLAMAGAGAGVGGGGAQADDPPGVDAEPATPTQNHWLADGLFARWSPSPEKEIEQNPVTGAQAAQLRAQLYTDVFRFPAITTSLNLDPTAVVIAHRYRRSAMETAQILAAAGQPDEGLRLLNVLYRHLPEWVIPMQIADMPVIAYYYQYGSPDRAGEMGMALGKRLSVLRQTDPDAAAALDTLKALAKEKFQSELFQYYERLLD